MIGLLALAAAAGAYPAEISYGRNSDEAQLARMVNEYRADNGLPPVPYSPSLSTVARAHVRDLMENRPDNATGFGRGPCNMHSWSRAGRWTPVCYTRDHVRASAMWNKPREITRYPGNGYEVAYWQSGRITPEVAFYGLQDSRAHDDVLVEDGPWRGANWQAMGVGIYGSYAVIWFGKERDRATGARRIAGR